MSEIFSIISLFSSIFLRTVDVAPGVIFYDLGVPRKLVIPSSECHKSREKLSLGL